MAKNLTESSFKESVRCYFADHGYSHVFEEAPFLTRHIDLCFFNPISNRVLAVELKVKNWGEALRQARAYQLCSDEVYVVMHPDFVHRVNLEAFRQFGIGLITFDPAPVVHVAASASPLRRRSLYNKMVGLLSSGISASEAKESGE